MKKNMALVIWSIIFLLSACGNKKEELAAEPKTPAKVAEKPVETEEKNGVTEGGNAKADSAILELSDVNEQYGNESFTELEKSTGYISNWSVTQENNKVSIFFENKDSIYRSTGENNKWLEKDAPVMKKDEYIPNDFSDFRISNTTLKENFMFRHLIKEEERTTNGYPDNKITNILLRTHLETKESVVIDTTEHSNLEYLFFSVSDGGYGAMKTVIALRPNEGLQNTFYIDGIEPIAIEEKVRFRDGFFDKKTGDFFYIINRHMERMNLLTGEHLYDGADRKKSESDVEAVGGFESNGYIFGTRISNTQDFKTYPCKLFMYNEELDQESYIEIPYNLKDSIQLVKENHILISKIYNYQDRLGLLLAQVNKPYVQ